jgi:hypothetical protein
LKTWLREEVRNTIFTEFWKIYNHDTKVAYVANLITSKPTVVRRERRIELEMLLAFIVSKLMVNEPLFVKTALRKLLDITNKFIAGYIKNKSSTSTGTPVNDKRGKQATVNKTSDSKVASFIAHINSFPAYDSHYTRKKVITSIYCHI